MPAFVILKSLSLAIFWQSSAMQWNGKTVENIDGVL